MNSPKGRASFANHLANHISCCRDIAKGNKVESSPFPEATAEEAAFFNQATNHPLMAHLAQ
jgi:hypothetical protein